MGEMHRRVQRPTRVFWKELLRYLATVFANLFSPQRTEAKDGAHWKVASSLGGFHLSAVSVDQMK